MTGPLREPAEGSVLDLITGDTLLRVGAVGFPQLLDPGAPPVFVTGVRPAEDEHTHTLVAVGTSTGTLYTSPDSRVLYARDQEVTTDTVLLISRRTSLHAQLVGLGIPLRRRTPLADSPAAERVTAEEWNTAPLVVIDGYLSVETLTSMWERGDLRDRDQIVMVCDDPDDQRVYLRRAIARARALFVLPYDEQGARRLFLSAVGAIPDRDPYLGILTPAPQPPV